eukprot:jgi/Botrbrau1/20209/Bobra.31_1s0006.1
MVVPEDCSGNVLTPRTGYVVQEGFFTNRRKHKLFYRGYLPKRPRAVLLYHHGYPQHIGLFDSPFCKAFRMFAEAGIALFAFDAHGFGKSRHAAAAPLYVETMDDFIDDVYTFRQDIIEAYSRTHSVLPVFVGGVSMGGLISILTVLRDQSQWQGLLLESPAVEPQWTLVLRMMAMVEDIFIHILPGWLPIVPGPQPECHSPYPHVAASLRQDPLIPFTCLRIRTAKSLQEGFALVAEQETELRLPLFVAQSPQDQAVSADAVRRFIANVSSEDITYHEYEEAHHVLLFCPERHHVVEQMVSWLLARASQITNPSNVSPKLHMVHRNGMFKAVKGGKWGVSAQELIQRPLRSTSNVAEVVVP